MNKKRNIYFDFLKALLIFLVTLGHVVQMVGCNNVDFWDNYVFKFIYTFHMPLFIAVSGYFFYPSLKKYSFAACLKNRILYVFVPMLMWCILTVGFKSLITAQMNIPMFLNSLESNYWFLWAIIIYSLVVCSINKLKIDSIPVLLASIVVITLMPFEALQYPLIKSMYPFFVIGYLCAKYDISRWTIFLKKYFYVVIPIAVVCYFLWDTNDYYYLTPSGFSTIKITLFRFFASSVISISFLMIAGYVYDKVAKNTACEKFSAIGEETLGIYLMQVPLLSFYLSYIARFVPFEVNNFVCILLSIILLFAMYGAILLLSKVKIFAFLLFGKRLK